MNSMHNRKLLNMAVLFIIFSIIIISSGCTNKNTLNSNKTSTNTSQASKNILNMADYIQKRNAATEYSLIYNMNYYPFEGRNTNSIVASNTKTISKNNNKVMRSFDDIEYSMNLPGERNIYSFYSIDDNYICENMIDKNNASTIGCFRQKYASPAEFNPKIIQIGGTLDISNVDATKDKIEYLGTENIINRNCDKIRFRNCEGNYGRTIKWIRKH